MESVFLALAGIAAGFINVVAAGGSMIGLPALMFVAGLPAEVANGSNRIAIILQNLVSFLTYRRRGALGTSALKKGSWLLGPALFGSVAGAYLASHLNRELIEKTIATVMVLMLFSLFVNPQRWSQSSRPSTPKLSLKEAGAFFFVGLYGGFIQLGVGLFVLTAGVFVSHFKLTHANALKVFIILSLNLVALAVFLQGQLVNFQAGLTLGLGTMLGGWLGTHASLKGGTPFIRWMLIIVISLSSAKLFGLF